MTIRVLLFAVLRDAVGHSEVALALPTGATAGDAVDRLAATHDAVARHRTVLRVAVNEHYVPLATPLADGDTLALLTPVSGG